MMMPAALLFPIFLVSALLWMFNISWGQYIYIGVFFVLFLVIIMFRPSRIRMNFPITSQSISSTLSLVMLLSMVLIVVHAISGNWWDVMLSAVIWLFSGGIWPQLKTMNHLG